VTTRGATLAALLAALIRPSWWILALAGFLSRGGILLFLLGVVSLPSPLAVSNVVAPLLVPIVFGGWTPYLFAVLALLVGSVLGWIVVGGWIGAATEIVLIRDARRAAIDEGVPTGGDGPRPRWLTVRVTAAHFLAHVPLAVVAAIGSISIVSVTYKELVTPFEVATPLVLRVVRGAAGPIVAIVIAWVIGELAGGIAARRIVGRGESIAGGVIRAYVALATRPASTLLPGALTLGVLGLELAATVAAVALSWTAARSRLADLPPSWPAIAFSVGALAAAWCLALTVAGIIAAWRSAAMTFEEERVAVAATTGDGVVALIPEAAEAGTIGASTHRRPGDWSAGAPGGSL
jgi:hypothetical protein